MSRSRAKPRNVMTSSAGAFKPTITELALLPVLVFLIALTRLYYGGGYSPMLVWKGELTFRDTFVDLGQLLKLSREELIRRHRPVMHQLEAMEILEPADVELESIRDRRWRGRSPAPGTQRPAPASLPAQ